jgi:hypothetical protein
VCECISPGVVWEGFIRASFSSGGPAWITLGFVLPSLAAGVAPAVNGRVDLGDRLD